MSDGDFQREDDKVYLPFYYKGTKILPEQYLLWQELRQEYELEQMLKEYEKTK